MNGRWNFLVTVLFVLGAWSAVPASDSSAPSTGKWELVWSDEFNASALDPSKWVVDTGGEGWGNHELEYYTARPQNVTTRRGKLVITALREKYTGSDQVSREYTSARLKSQGKFSQAYGRFEARIKIPYGQGMWPAFWMLGDDIDTASWPNCGEIDVMENIGREPFLIHGSIHGTGYSGDVGIEAPYRLPGKKPFAHGFHLFAVEWEPAAVRFYVDKTLYVTRTPADLHPGWKWVFDHPFFLLLNLAVGGDWPGSPDASTVFPRTMLVDYVRVYRRAGSVPAETKP